VEVAYISFNEANLGINVLLNPQDVIALVKLAGPRFAELGLKTKWLLGDCSNVRDCLAYIQPIWAEESTRQYFGPLAFHSWDVLSVTDPRLEEIAAFALENGLEVRCTEAGWDAALWQRAEEFPGWNNALRLALVYSRVLKLSRATTMYYWEMFAQDYNLNDGQEPYPAMNVLKLLNDRIPPGSQVVGASPNGSNRHILAAKTPQGMALLIVNASLKETVHVSGLPDGDYELTIFHDKDRQGTSQVISLRNRIIELELPGFSILMLAQQS
jgi:hypothetical protein